MSNTWLNIRFGEYHLQVLFPRDWPLQIRERRSPIRWSRNAYQAEARKNDPEWRWFAVYDFGWPW